MNSPMRTVVAGFVAGVSGAGVQSLFFRATRKLAPSPPKDVFDPPEERQKSETATATVARRAVEDLMQRGPLENGRLERGAKVVHYAFGGLWGIAYGLVREERRRPLSLAGIVGYSALVWMIADNFILPAFKLAAWPASYPPSTHAYALAAHVPYGVAVAACYELVRAAELH